MNFSANKTSALTNDIWLSSDDNMTGMNRKPTSWEKYRIASEQ